MSRVTLVPEAYEWRCDRCGRAAGPEFPDWLTSVQVNQFGAEHFQFSADLCDECLPRTHVTEFREWMLAARHV